MLLGITAEVQLQMRFLRPSVSRLAQKGRLDQVSKVWGHFTRTPSNCKLLQSNSTYF